MSICTWHNLLVVEPDRFVLERGTERVELDGASPVKSDQVGSFGLWGKNILAEGPNIKSRRPIVK